VDFALDDSQVMLRDTTRRFLESEAAMGGLRARLEAPEVTDVAQWRAGVELGWASMLIPESLGGGSVTHQPMVDLAVLAEEIGRVLYPAPFLPTNVVADALARHGGNPYILSLLDRITSGSPAAWCLTGDGTADPGAVQVRARGSGADIVLDGVARYVHGASCARVLLVAATTPSGTVTYLALPSESAGIGVRVMSGLDLTRRLCEVRFEGVGVPAEAVLEPSATSGPLALWDRALAIATVIQAAEALGGADRLFSRTVAYAKDRVQFGRPIGSFQAIKHRLSDLLVEVEGMRAATYYAALALGDGLPDAQEAVAVAGAWVTDAYARVCGEALQLHGGIGFTWEHDAHLYLRRAKVDQVLYGEPRHHREVLCRLLEADRKQEDAS
jgi:alkylation response protein AidB-like acyl-CoA dehydrogenase